MIPIMLTSKCNLLLCITAMYLAYVAVQWWSYDELRGWYVYSDRSPNWVLENLQLHAEVWYSTIVVNALSLFTLHGSASGAWWFHVRRHRSPNELVALAAGILFARASRYGSQIRWSIPRSASTAMIWAISEMLWEDVFCQSKRSMTDCMGQEDIAFSLGFGIHRLLPRAWCAEELQVSYIFYLWGSKCLRLWPRVLSSFVFLFVATRHFLFGSLLFFQFFSSLTCRADVYVFPLSYLCFYADLICCNLLFGPLSLQVVAVIKFTSLDCWMYREACISTSR
jgi:hypothetical protein